jgi:hypothetical protein
MLEGGRVVVHGRGHGGSTRVLSPWWSNLIKDSLFSPKTLCMISDLNSGDAERNEIMEMQDFYAQQNCLSVLCCSRSPGRANAI